MLFCAASQFCQFCQLSANFLDNIPQMLHEYAPVADPGAVERQELNLSLNDVVLPSTVEQRLIGIVSVSTNMFSMSWLERDKEQNRFYLLPGMGGSAFRRKRRRILLWSLAAGLLVSAAVACILYAMSAH